MAGGLAALLDDIAALARMAAANIDDVAAAAGRASVKAAGVVIDDTAVTPRMVSGIGPSRELPIIRRIALGSLVNKIVIILPIILLVSWLAPWLLGPVLMVGGSYLCYEGAEKVWEYLSGHRHEEPALGSGGDEERRVVRGAITTDLVLSAEIMVMALGEVATEPLVRRAIILVVVALLITALVYGVVAVIVKMDDVGLALVKRGGRVRMPMGRGLVRAMPVVLRVLSVVGVLAMLWVGGHIFLAQLPAFGLPDLVPAHWLLGILASFLFGLALGSLFVLAGRTVQGLRRRGD